ncbi:S-adenosylmethionine:tRNA ribosyltransferase-isomerase [Dysgonomonas sp. ZJ279]|uniref:S-adenosylmethionine:tRNA ribosyltransferase-isomerase n=1 Tax=Dysgonomonas sp. ZJ279 TaxID=2709796 RepID=UPI0013ED1AF9|nr:S-adenosylmethionine:tRNA ribosyltransferase-isomerase [Dysgonomonas sp. ZJ279]
MEISNPREIRIDDYNYNLPDDRIAKYPLAERDSSKLLIYRQGAMTDTCFKTLPDHLPADSLMIFNNTKVIQARMHFRKQTGALIEIFCLEPYQPNDYLLNFQQTERCSWICLVGNLKKWKEGELIKALTVHDCEILIRARKLQSHGDSHIIEFEWDNINISFSDILECGGELPIPPYLNRDTEEKDKETYQTVYSKIKGSVAAPTAGLHFTDTVFSALKEKGIVTDEVTLHVGAGTFKPVKSEQIKDHEMHSEFISVRKDLIERLLNHKGKVIAVGTTSVRTLESLYYLGELLENDQPEELTVSQWQPYLHTSNRLSKEKALKNILAYLDSNKLNTLIANTQIIIAPGYEFKIVDGVVTNFHQPKSTLLLLVSAFVSGNDWKKIYEHALNNDYRFLSYGDSSLLLKD